MRDSSVVLRPSVAAQRGGTLLGFIAGLIVGLAIALGVAVYITKVPIPFMNKGGGRSADQDASEEQKNKDWDPNAPLYGKNPARPATDKGDAAGLPPVSDAKPKDVAAKVDPKSTDPLGDLAKAASKNEAKAEARPTADKPTTPATPAATVPAAVAVVNPPAAAAAPPSDPFMYFVQAGAYRTTDEAEAQRVKLVMLGLDAKISERDQGGRTVYRVRVGPLNVKTDAEKVRDKLDAAHIDSAMVRVQR